MQKSISNLFLMNPENERFLRKQIDQPFLHSSRLWELALLGLFFAAVFLAFLVFVIPSWLRWLDLNNNGVTTTAQVAAVNFEEQRVSYFYVTYSFSAAGQTYEAMQKVDLERFESLIANDQNLPVRYVAADPTISQLEAPYEDFGDLRVEATFLGGIFLLVIGAAFFIHLDRWMSNETLINKGRVIKGSVVSAVGSQPGQDSAGLQALLLLLSPAYWRLRRSQQNQFTVKIHYQFVSPTTNRELMRTERKVRSDLDRRGVPEPGTRVAVLFHNDGHYRLL